MKQTERFLQYLDTKPEAPRETRNTMIFLRIEGSTLIATEVVNLKSEWRENPIADTIAKPR